MEPIATIEKDLEDSSKLMGEMVQDVFYMLDNQVFISTVQNAVIAHQNWLKTLETMVETGECTPLQTDDAKCAFGHFYYAVKPQNPKVIKMWENIKPVHAQLHDCGKKAVEALKNGNQSEARSWCDKAVQVSKGLLKDFDVIVQLTREIDSENKRVFEA